MQIKLISPTSYDLNNKLIRVKRATLPPLSLLYIAALTPKKHTVSIIDETVQSIDFEEPIDLVGLTSTTFTVRRAYKIADTFRARKIKVIMGGIHASSEIEEALEHVDSVVVGEAETAWKNVLDDVENGKLKRIYKPKPLSSLSNLPAPLYGLIDKSKYARLPFRASPILPIQTTRGCPFNCEFCSVSKFWGKRIRTRPVKEVIKEIKYSKANTIFFTDDNFFSNSKRTVEMCRSIAKLKIKYICQIDSLALHNPIAIKALSKSGCILVFVGFESLNKHDLENINKGFNDPQKYPLLIDLLHKNGVNVYASIILGFKNDTPETAKNTADFLIDQKVSLAAFFRLTPFPGTTLYEKLKWKGYLTNEKWWLRRGEGSGSIIDYPNRTYHGEDLSSIAMKRFYSWRSIIKRFFPARHFSPYLLGLNIRAHYRLKKHIKTTLL